MNMLVVIGCSFDIRNDTVKSEYKTILAKVHRTHIICGEYYSYCPWIKRDGTMRDRYYTLVHYSSGTRIVNVRKMLPRNQLEQYHRICFPVLKNASAINTDHLSLKITDI
jgi:hypothetical protein